MMLECLVGCFCAPKDIKMDSPFKPKAESDVVQIELDLYNIIINLMNQGILSASVEIGQDLELN